jgi:hypothetical protein
MRFRGGCRCHRPWGGEWRTATPKMDLGSHPYGLGVTFEPIRNGSRGGLQALGVAFGPPQNGSRGGSQATSLPKATNGHPQTPIFIF